MTARPSPQYPLTLRKEGGLSDIRVSDLRTPIVKHIVHSGTTLVFCQATQR
jgi:hypothetical protein